MTPQKAPKEREVVFDVATGVIIESDAVRLLSDNFVRYALYISRSRAVPDVRDGLKPVQRRILWGSLEVAPYTGKHVKSANIVGHVMGRYHPHGDSSIYETMVRLTQTFNMRLPLVDPQGNFGSPSDGAAAYRYTEARLNKVSQEEFFSGTRDHKLLAAMVGFKDNYDGQHQEPGVLPVSFPHLLVNGAQGIAVGIITNIPPHNLGEVCDATLVLLDNPEATVDDIMRKLKGPDLPTGGVILADEHFRAMYATGKGAYTAQALVEVGTRNGRPALFVNEILYQTSLDSPANGKGVIEKINDLVQDGTIEGIINIRNESAKGEYKCVIELKKEADPERVLRQLLAHRGVGLRDRRTFDMTVVSERKEKDISVLVPGTLGIKNVIQHWIDFRTGTIRNRSQFYLTQLRDQEHVHEGLLKAIDIIDKVIATIKASKSAAEGLATLQKKFDFSERQAEKIMEMQLRQLASLEQQRLRDALVNIRKEIKDHEEILAKKERVRQIIRDDLARVKTDYGTPRRTKIISGDDASAVMALEETVADEVVALTVNTSGFAKRFRTELLAKRNGERDAQDNFACVGTMNARDNLLMFTKQGKAYLFKASRFPDARPSERGAALEALVQMTKGDVAVALLRADANEYAFFTAKGEVKRVAGSDFANAHAGGILALTLEKGDGVVSVSECTEKQSLIVATRAGQALRFKAADVRRSGRGSGTVRAITLKKNGDEVLVGGCGDNDTFLVTVTDTGFAKRTPLKEIPLQGRSTTGVRAMSLTSRATAIAAALVCEEGDYTLLRQKANSDPKVVPLSKIVTQPRDRAGQRLLTICHGGVTWSGQATAGANAEPT